MIKGMRSGIGVSVLFMGLATQASAADFSGCYKRTYDAAHMAANPRQQVTAIAVHVVGDAKTPATAGITAKLRGSPWDWSTAGDCKRQADALACDFLETGGSALLTRRADGLRVEIVGAGGLVLDAETHEKTGGERTLKTLSKKEDGLFLLPVAPASACE